MNFNANAAGLGALLQNSRSSSGSSGTSYFSSISSSSTSTTPLKALLLSVVFRASLILILVGLVLLVVNYTITPIFKTNPDGPGIIPVPSVSSDDAVFWKNKTSTAAIAVSTTPIGSSSSGINYSITLDILVDSSFQSTGLPRIIFYKGGLMASPPPANQAAAATVLTLVPDAALVVALLKDTNDLQVAITTEHGLEGVLLSNVPTRTPFRLGMIVADRTLEVYTNGKLARTKTLSSPPLAAASGSFWPPQGMTASIAQVRNLHVWPRAIGPGELRAALPPLPGLSVDFNISQLQETSVCPATPADAWASGLAGLSGAEAGLSAGLSGATAGAEAGLSAGLSGATAGLSGATAGLSGAEAGLSAGLSGTRRGFSTGLGSAEAGLSGAWAASGFGGTKSS